MITELLSTRVDSARVDSAHCFPCGVGLFEMNDFISRLAFSTPFPPDLFGLNLPHPFLTLSILQWTDSSDWRSFRWAERWLGRCPLVSTSWVGGEGDRAVAFFLLCSVDDTPSPKRWLRIPGMISGYSCLSLRPSVVCDAALCYTMGQSVSPSCLIFVLALLVILSSALRAGHWKSWNSSLLMGQFSAPSSEYTCSYPRGERLLCGDREGCF